MSNYYYLAHHGILGQKWGKQNGPPYPLDYNKLSKEEREKAKESAIRRGDVAEAQANRDYFTDQEVRQLMDRFDLNKKLSQLNEVKKQDNFEKVENFVNKVDKTAKMVDKGVDAWNTVAKISNGLGLLEPHELPVIDKRDPWNKPKEKITKKTEFYDIEDGKATRTKWVETDSDGNSKTFNVINKDKSKSSNNDTKVSSTNNIKESPENSNKDQTKTKTDNSKSNSVSYDNYENRQWNDLFASRDYDILSKAYNSETVNRWNDSNEVEAYTKDLLNKNISDLDNYYNKKK